MVCWTCAPEGILSEVRSNRMNQKRVARPWYSALIRRDRHTSPLTYVSLLRSALGTPSATFGGQFRHAGLVEIGAAYLFPLVQNHPFLDGNKRVGAVAALVFCALNAVDIEVTEDEFADLSRPSREANSPSPRSPPSSAGTRACPRHRCSGRGCSVVVARQSTSTATSLSVRRRRTTWWSAKRYRISSGWPMWGQISCHTRPRLKSSVRMKRPLPSGMTSTPWS